MKKIDVTSHKMVPQHRILAPDEAQDVFEHFGIKATQLPKILAKDPAVKAIGAQVGEILKITRESETAGVSIAYRIVAE